jgi:hypothetical protein
MRQALANRRNWPTRAGHLETITPGVLLGFVVLASLVFLFLAAPATAHFRLNTNLRIFHIERLESGVRIYLRLPTPLVYARELAAAGAPDQAIEAPYITSAEEAGVLVHRIDVTALEADPIGYGQLVAQGYRVVISGQEIAPEVEAVAVNPANMQLPFAERAQAKTALKAPPYPPAAPPAYVGDTVTDLQLFFPSTRPDGEIRLSEVIPADYEPSGFIANIFLDEVDGERRISRASGLLREPVLLNTSALTAASTFVEQGIWHILEGLDHVLFVLCLTIGATTIGALLWRVTGFTLGHTVTLIAGSLGYTPSGDWFIPAVETAIALSIVYAGAIALLKKPGASTIPITVGIGLLHGFGFSFVLADMLDLEAPHLLVSLVSFNIGVEIGQVAIVLAVWPALFYLGRRWAGAKQSAIVVLATAASGIAIFWTVERVIALGEILIGAGLT